MRIGLDGMLLGGAHSGVEHAVECLARALPEVAPQHEYLLVCRREYAARSPLPAVVAARWTHGRLLRLLYEQTRLAGDLRGRCDLLHAPAYLLPLNWRGPSVLTVYDLIALQFPDLAKTSNVLNYRLLLPRSLARADRIIVPSQTVADDIRRLQPAAEEKLRVIPLGLDAKYRPAPEAETARVRQTYGLPERFILCVGNIEPKKNLPAVLRAFETVARELPHDLVIVGRRAWKTGEFDRTLASLRVRERVHLVGYAAPEDLPALYTLADLLVQWSHYEGMGLPPLEAMACGTPALVSDQGALPEIAGPAAEVAPLGPPAALAERLSALLSSPERLGELRRLGLAHAARFSWDTHARSVVALYEETLNAHV